jgi:hypothetical protein
MTDYTISCKLSNETVYAYYRGRFWHWNGSIWKESRIMTHRFELAKAADKKLTPPEFLSNGAEFAPLDEYEIDSAMLDALENAKPCKNAPIEPVKEDPTCKTAPNADAAAITAERAAPNATAEMQTTSESAADASESVPAASPQSCESGPAASAEASSASLLSTAPQEKPLTTVPDAMRPAFDYSGLTDQTVENLHFAEDEYRHGKQMAERGLVHMGNAIAAAHDALCGVVAQCDNGEDGACRTMRKARNNQHSEDTFKSWCVTIGITKDTAYRLLQVSALLDGSSPRQQKVLKELSPTLLYAVAKPSAPAELVEQVKNGDITTNKQYQEALAQIKAEKSRADTAEAERDKLLGAQNRAAWAESHIQDVEAQRDAALADVQGLTEQNAKLQQSYHDADESRIAANLQRQKAEAERDKAEARAKNAEDALKKQPIVGVTDPEEVRRQADALAAEAKAQASRQIEDAQRRAREAEARYQKLQQDADGFLAPEQSCAQQAKIIADSMRSMYLGWFGLASTTGTPLARMAAPIYQVCDEIRESLEEDTTINPTAEGSVEDAEREALFE